MMFCFYWIPAKIGATGGSGELAQAMLPYGLFSLCKSKDTDFGNANKQTGAEYARFLESNRRMLSYLRPRVWESAPGGSGRVRWTVL